MERKGFGVGWLVCWFEFWKAPGAAGGGVGMGTMGCRRSSPSASCSSSSSTSTSTTSYSSLDLLFIPPVLVFCLCLCVSLSLVYCECLFCLWLGKYFSSWVVLDFFLFFFLSQLDGESR